MPWHGDLVKVAVIGASGFLGSAVVEYLHRRGVEVVPLAGSTGNSWRLVSQGYTPRVVNVLDRDRLDVALSDCTQIVNCLRGDDNVMLGGMENLLRAARRLGIARLVHVSSVAVFGDPPPPAACRESAPALPQKGSYGWIKLRQDRMVMAASRKGLSCAILCPPNIIGPGSDYLLQILDALLQGSFPLVDGGEMPCNTVDVTNLAHACWLALTSNLEGCERYFITDDECVQWGRIVDRLQRAAGIADDCPRISRSELQRLLAQRSAPRPSFLRAVRHVVSSDVRKALRRDPLLAMIDSALRKFVTQLGPRLEEGLRRLIERPAAAAPHEAGDTINLRLCSQQLRDVVHSCARAKEALGYRPLYTFDQSMDAFAAWLAATRGMEGWDWAVRKRLFGYAAEPSGGVPRPEAAGG
jgi:nucleoside-diphosphate-sugar epimerase